MKLKDYLADKSVTELDIAGISIELNTDGEKIAVLTLAKPVEVVQGSQFVVDPVSGQSERIIATDVETVRVHENNWDTVDIPEDGKGLMKTNNLRLDVAKRSGEVYLTAQSFAGFGRAKRNERNAEQVSGIVARMNDRKAKLALKNADTSNKPESVAANG